MKRSISVSPRPVGGRSTVILVLAVLAALLLGLPVLLERPLPSEQYKELLHFFTLLAALYYVPKKVLPGVLRALAGAYHEPNGSGQA